MKNNRILKKGIAFCFLLSLCLLIFQVHAGPLTAVLMNGQPSNSIAAYNTTWQIGTIAAATVPASPITNNFNTYIGNSSGTGYGFYTSGYTFTNVNSAGTTVIITNEYYTNIQATLSAGGFLITGSQANTNFLPLYAVNTSPGYPSTLYGPANNVSIQAAVSLNSATTPARAFVFNFWKSNDGTNYNIAYLSSTNNFSAADYTLTVTVPAGGTYASAVSNFSLGGTPYLVLGQMINTNEMSGTNILITASQKPGI
jgi:hypothetical protein